MADSWIEGFSRSVKPDRIIFDAMAEPIPNVIKARQVDEETVEALIRITDEEGNDLVGSRDGGKTLEPIEAYITIHGGMIVDLTRD